ncbi:MAG: hypothetical protein NTX03_07060 [Bacteroidetes bacterium]|nr:hypothetical protein [Bacteroidota bacterium]
MKRYYPFKIEFKIASLGLLLVVFFTSCQKETIIHENATVHKDTTISGNKAPIYDGVSSLQIQTYINRMYIDLMGRKPTDTELNSGFNTLKANPHSDVLRETVINTLLKTDAYYRRFYDYISDKLINGADSADISERIYIYKYLLGNYTKTGEKYYVNYLNIEIKNLQSLMNCTDNYKQKKFGIDSVYNFFLVSYFYDQINMGNENFVKACFENLLYRDPTKEELRYGKDMYDNKAGILFRETGICKNDIIKIITKQDEFYQGLVIDAYLSFLLRKPNTAEISVDAKELIASKRLENLRIKLLKSKEYAGF